MRVLHVRFKRFLDLLYHKGYACLLLPEMREKRTISGMEQKKETEITQKAVILHGFTNEQIYMVLKVVKHVMGESEDVAFATTTPHSLSMKLGDVIADVTEEHAYMKNNPPQQAAPSPEHTTTPELG